MQPYLNALMFKFEGDGGENAPSGLQIAITWGAVGALAMHLLQK